MKKIIVEYPDDLSYHIAIYHVTQALKDADDSVKVIRLYWNQEGSLMTRIFKEENE